MKLHSLHQNTANAKVSLHFFDYVSGEGKGAPLEEESSVTEEVTTFGDVALVIEIRFGLRDEIN